MRLADFAKLDEMLEKGGRISQQAELEISGLVDAGDVFDFELEVFTFQQDEKGESNE
jgi:hypothetical protein